MAYVVSFCCIWADSSLDQSELVAELLKELSNHNERVEERKAALCELLKLIRENTLQVWDEHFKTILLLLLETMGDREVHYMLVIIPCLISQAKAFPPHHFLFSQHVIRTLALRVLREILGKQPWRFKNYAELTIMKALEAHKDPHKEVHSLTQVQRLISSLQWCKGSVLHHADVSVGGTSSRGDGSHVGAVHQSRPVHQGVVSHHPVSRLSHQPCCHQDADQSGGEDSQRGPYGLAAWDSARTHTGNTQSSQTYPLILIQRHLIKLTLFCLQRVLSRITVSISIKLKLFLLRYPRIRIWTHCQTPLFWTKGFLISFIWLTRVTTTLRAAWGKPVCSVWWPFMQWLETTSSPISANSQAARWPDPRSLNSCCLCYCVRLSLFHLRMESGIVRAYGMQNCLRKGKTLHVVTVCYQTHLFLLRIYVVCHCVSSRYT